MGKQRNKGGDRSILVQLRRPRELLEWGLDDRLVAWK